MELYFMPSDIARLILGYLQENSYLKTYNCFLRECGHLRELYNLEKAGRSLKKVTQLSLIKIVEEWGRYKYSSEAKHSGVTSISGAPSSDDTVDDNLVFDNDVTSSGRKTKQKASSGWSKKSPQVSKVRRSPSTPKLVKVRLKSPRVGTEIQNTEVDHSFEEDAAQPGSSIQTIEASGGSKNSSPTKTTPSKLKLHSQGDVPDDTQRPEELIDETESFNNKGSRKQAVPCSQRSDSFKKSAENVVINKMKVALFKQLESHITCGEMSGCERKESKLTEQENDRTSFSEHETDKAEPGCRNNKIEKNTEIMSETYIKPVSEPPSESVGSVDDKCLSWMTRNDSEGTYNTGETGDITATLVERKPSPKSSNEGSPTTMQTTPKKLTHLATKNRLSVTPIKLLLSSEHNTSKSPRRKKPKTPRKRASEVSPVSSVVSTKVVETSNIFEKILSDHRLHEKLAETCNLVHSQIKLASSGRDKSDTTHAVQVSQIPLHHTEEQETVTASRSLEEILGIDNNFHTDLLSDNIDMSDPAYESLFRLFGTDRETFNEYLRREKEKELALMEAEVEELERSNHEILCANFGVSQADAGYETQELAYNSPHHIVHGTQHDHFSSNHNLHSPRTSRVTSTPCGTGALVNFTPLLRGNQLGSSPVSSTSLVFGGSEKIGTVAKASPGSTETQPFSPALSHYSEVNNPPTPRHQQHLSSYINGGSPGVPHTPKSHTVDPYSNPATPQQSSPQHNQLLHSTPTGSVRSNTDSEHFHQSSPIHAQHNTITNVHLPTQCSPLVKADLHPQSPFSTQNQTNFFQPATNNSLYFNSHIIARANTQNEQNLEHNVNNSAGIENFSDNPGYLALLTDDGSNAGTSGEHCTTIENTIGCISLPQPSIQATRTEDEKKGAARKSRRKKPPVKRREPFASLKEILNKPLRFPNSVPLTMTAPGLHLPKTPEKRIPDDANLTFRSPGGKTMINVPVLNCEEEIDLSILGMEENVDADDSQIVNVYGKNLDTSTQYIIAPENQATHDLASAIRAGNTADTVKQISQWKKTESKSRKKATSECKSKVRKKKTEVVKEDQHKEDFNSIPSSSDHLVFHQDGFLDPNEEVYTATLDTSIGKTATARALNFGPNVDNYRKIMPKPSQETGPSVLILSSKQMVNPGHKIVVNTNPVTLVQNSSDSVVQSNEKVIENDELPEIESISTIKIIDMSDSSGEKKGALSTSTSNEKDPIAEGNSGVSMKAHSQEETPNKVKQNFGHNSDCSSEKRVTRSVTLLKSTEKSQSIKVNQNSDTMVTEDEQKVLNTPKKDVTAKMLCISAKVNLGTALNCVVSSKENNSTQSPHRDYHENITDAAENNIDKKELSESVNKSSKNTVKYSVKSKSCKNKKGKGNEKLKVKLPVMSYRPVNQKTKEKKSEKALIPFYFKKKPEDLAEISSSDEDLPLSEIRKQQVKSKSKRMKQTEFQSVKIVIDSESTDEDTEAVKEKVQLTPKKRIESADEDRTPSKEILFEKIGLTPKKLVMESEFKSPRRKNVLDVLAEWQGSPLSSGKCQEVKSVESHRSPRTPGKRGHAKQLFSSPDKKKRSVKVCKKAKQTAKRVNGIIDRLKQNNPGRILDGSYKHLSQDKNDEIMETDVLRVAYVNPGVNDETEDSVKNSNEMIKNDIKTTLLDGNEQMVTCDENSFPADCNSQDENELDQAIASIAFKQQDALYNKKISEEEIDNECKLNKNAEQNDGFIDNNLEHSQEKQCISSETETENVKHSNIAADSVKQDNIEEGTVNSEQVESRRKHKKKKHKHRHRHKHRRNKNNEINGVDDQTGSCLNAGAEHHHHHKKRKRSKKRHLEEGEEGRERKRRRKEKKGETNNTSVEMDSLAAINIDEAITKIYGT